MDERLTAMGGYDDVVLRRELLEDGYNDREIAREVRSGDLHRVRHGAYISGDRWAELSDLHRHGAMGRAVVKQACSEVVLSHVSALPAYDAPTWGLDLTNVHLTRKDRRGGRREAGVIQHVGTLLAEDVVTSSGLAVTSATRTALDITTVAEVEAALVVVDYLLNRRLTSAEALTSRYAAMTQWPNTLRTDLVLRLADGRSESVGETRARDLCRRHRLPAPVPQYPIHDEHGRIVAYVDLAWPQHGVFLEFDGRIKYGALLQEGETPTDVVLREKRREELICELTGWRCIRITWADLAYPARTAARIHRLLFPIKTAA
jgi:hypothetical protein